MTEMDVNEHDDMLFEDNNLKGLTEFALVNRTDETFKPFPNIR